MLVVEMFGVGVGDAASDAGDWGVAVLRRQRWWEPRW